MKNRLLSVLNVFKGDKEQSHISANHRLTNQRLLDEFVEIFEYKLKDLSVGDKMLFPMSFSIIMHSTDYAKLKETLHFVTGQAVLKFYGIINKYSKEYSDTTEPAETWHFQISPSTLDKIPLGDDQTLDIHPGEITVMESGIFSYKKEENSQVDVESSVRVSVRVKNSNVFKDININKDTLLGFNTLAEGVFTFPYNIKGFNEKNTTPKKETTTISSEAGFATLSYEDSGKSYTFTMKSSITNISGKDEVNTGKSVFKIGHTNLINQHIQVRYLQDDNRFEIAAYAPTRLNGRDLQISSINNPQWKELKNGSTIFANGEVKLTFKVK